MTTDDDVTPLMIDREPVAVTLLRLALPFLDQQALINPDARTLAGRVRRFLLADQPGEVPPGD